MRKIYILDTSVLAHDPYAFTTFSDCDIVIPIGVLEELDKLKKLSNETGKNARVCIKALDAICEQGQIHQGISIENNIILKIDTVNNINTFGPDSYVDNRILACAFCIKDAILISRDINLRVRARAFGMKAEDYEKDKTSSTDLFAGFKEIESEELGNLLTNKQQIDYRLYDELHGILSNECVHFVDENGDGISIGRRISDKIKVIHDRMPWGLDLRNKEQAFAVDMLCDPKLPLVTLIGSAGTGKSICALASGLEMVLEKKFFDKFIIYRPIQAVGSDIGYLPGTLEEKLGPWMSAIYDGFEFLFEARNGNKWQTMFEMYIEKKKIQMEAITYIRGRSIPNAFIMIDECFPYNQYIETENGKKRIGILNKMFLQNQQLPMVKTYNEQTEDFEYKKILNVWNRGEKSLIKLTCGNREIKCTENHPFLTEKGWKKAGNLEKGDLIKTTSAETHQLLRALNDDQLQIVLGSFLGDGNISNHGLYRNRLRVVHGIDQEDYCAWKASMFHSKIENILKNGYSQKPAVRFTSKIFGLHETFPKNKTTCPQWVLDKLDARGLAIWFMDDGSTNKCLNAARISTCSFDEDSQKRIVEKLKSMGIDCQYVFHNMKEKRFPGYYSINLKKEGYRKLCEIIEPFVHENLHYKIFMNNVDKYIWNNYFKKNGLTVVDNIEILNKKETVYDIEVEDNHNFIICPQGKSLGGLIAHNCQNLSREEIKTILTRAGPGTKIVLTGDIEQIDAPSLDATNNGLAYVAEKFKDSDLAGHITFTKGERSALASKAAEIL